MTLPARRKRPPTGIERAPKREWPRHRAFVRRHGCCVNGCQSTDIEFAHLRSAANSGTGLKPADWFGVSLCAQHHDEAHSIGHDSFAAKHGIDLWKMAAEFARLSPDLLMKEEMRK